MSSATGNWVNEHHMHMHTLVHTLKKNIHYIAGYGNSIRLSWTVRRKMTGNFHDIIPTNGRQKPTRPKWIIAKFFTRQHSY